MAEELLPEKTMNPLHSPRHTLAALATLVVSSLSAHADILASENFAYSDGALLGQGGWTITGTSVVNPLAVSNGAVTLATTGQDAYKALSASLNLATNGGVYYSMDLSVASAQAAGDYFFHLSDPVGTTSNFYARLLVKSSGSGFLLGLQEQSGTGAAATYGTTELSFNTSYKVVVAWNVITGATNDSFSLYLAPSNSAQTSNTAYVTDLWTSTTVEPATITAFNLRQGSAANAAGVTVDKIVVASTFAEAAGLATVPEPSSFAALAGLVALAGAASRRRARA